MEVLVTKRAAKQLDVIPDALAKKIVGDLAELSKNPYPRNSKKLSGIGNYRLRIGVYRAIYEVDKKGKKITILRIKHRREIYR